MMLDFCNSILAPPSPSRALPVPFNVNRVNRLAGSGCGEYDSKDVYSLISVLRGLWVGVW